MYNKFITIVLIALQIWITGLAAKDPSYIPLGIGVSNLVVAMCNLNKFENSSLPQGKEDNNS